MSARLWSMTCRRLPAMRRQVWLGTWSMATVLGAVFVVGGFSYWYQFYKPKKFADRSLVQAIADAARGKGKDKSLEEAVADFANTQDLTKKKVEKKEKEDKRATQDCVIIGYTVDVDKDTRKQQVSSLVLAAEVDGKVRFVGLVRRGIGPRASEELLKRLAPLVQPEPFLPGLNLQAIWVKPQVFCEVHQSGFDKDGRLRDPQFKDLLTQQ